MSALDYNKKQNYDADIVAKIQRTVGSTADGKWGKRTVVQIKSWQKAQGLPADGKVGPGTLEHFEKLWAADAAPEGDEDLDDVPEGEDPPEVDAAADDDDGGERPPIAIGEGFNYFDQNVDLDTSSSGDAVLALENDLFAFGFFDDMPNGKFDSATTKAVAAFQEAAQTPDRIANYARIKVDVTYQPGKSGVVDAATRAEIRLWKEKGYRYQEGDYEERRVRVNKLGTIPRSSNVLVDVPGTGGKTRKLHRLVAEDLAKMAEACKAETGVELLVQSGWRNHRWTSRKQYEETVKKKYGSVEEGARWLAYSSAHETGLAVDIGSGGLEASRKTAAKQKQTPVFKWLVANAYRFGFTPYKAEPWHWEHPLSLRAWTTGLSDWRVADDLGDDD